MARVFVGFADKVATAFAAFGSAQHIVVDEFHQAPSACDGEQGFDTAGGNLFVVKAERFHHCVDVFQRADLGQIFIRVQE